ncbi:MAG: hypothetical protein EZS28_016697 [Streblomastix strix]|uniref:Reverse transcriptase domain-containing protein n=1 Tax=Streblomastix strix TaxID=222440 RepID=A0A5J4VYN1_9EUKA|nr:MAG: hypothetical protein EZS28_016697 [Streblomastix strix]
MKRRSKKALNKLNQNRRIIEVKSCEKLKSIFSEELNKEIKYRIVAKLKEKEVKYLNPQFVIPKAGGKFRKMLDCREVNKATEQLYFKIDGIKEIMQVIQLKDFATKIDLEATYHQIKVIERMSRYFEFRYEGHDCVFKDLPFGYMRNPFIFYKPLKVEIKAIREQVGVRLVTYMEFLLLLEQDRRALDEDTV